VDYGIVTIGITPAAIASAALALILLSLATAHIVGTYPLANLGKRPLGRGLWSYLYSQLFSFGRRGRGGSTSRGTSTGVWGYDSSLGSFAPMWRVSFHISGCMMMYALALIIRPVDNLKLLLSVVGLYMGTFWMIDTFLPGVSHPGGPRESKIRRMPQWKNVTTTIDERTLNHTTGMGQGGSGKWRCAVAEDAHRVTLQRFNLDPASHGGNGVKTSQIGMSGEPSGRQIWTTLSNENEAKVPVELTEAQIKLIQDMARADRPSGGFNPSVNPNAGDIIFREQLMSDYVQRGGSLPNVDNNDKNGTGTGTGDNIPILEATRKAVHFYSMLQTNDGHWGGDYGGPHFLMPGIIIAWYIMGRPSLMLNQSQCELMVHYLKVHQQVDGGWGTHIESPSTMFGSVLSYVSLRLLGVKAEEEYMLHAKKFIHKEGGAVMTSSWAKFWLCLLGCMEWEGHNSVPPEIWLLPNWFPFHPGRMWCHARMVYLPMGYCYGSRFVYEHAETDVIVQALRKELYCSHGDGNGDAYAKIPWTKTRHMVAEMDNYSPLPFVMELAQNCLDVYETLPILQPIKNFVRAYGLKFCSDYMEAEDLQTNFINIGPVNKVMNMVSAYHAAGNDIDAWTVKNHMMRIEDYLWLVDDGLKIQGYNRSQC